MQVVNELLLLHYVGKRVNNIFDTLPDRGENNNLTATCDVLTAHFTPKKNVSFEIFEFRKLQQASGESIDENHTRKAAKCCEFHDNDTEIKLQIELGTSRNKLRQHSFPNPSLTLTDLLGYARTLAETEKQASGIANSSVSMAFPPEVNTLTQSGSLPNTGRKEPSQQPAEVTTKNASDADFLDLTKTNLALPNVNSATIARSAITSAVYAGRRKQPNNEIHNVKQDNPQLESNDSDEYVYTLQNTTDKNNFHQTLKVENTEISLQIDPGSTTNTIDETSFKNLIKNPNLTLTKSKKRLFAFAASTPLQVVGQFQCTIESLNKLTTATVFVEKNETGCLLSGQTAIELDLVRLKVNTVTTPNCEDMPPRLTPLIQGYSDVFTRVGKLKDFKVHLHIDQNVKPVVQPTRHISLAIGNKAEVELKHSENSDIIEPATGPTPWVSPIVVSKASQG